MDKSDSNCNEHGAAGTIAGFSYQIAFFILRLLDLKKGESVSLEKFEDVGSEDSKHKDFYQLKHTVKGTDAKPINMTKLDNDLWKTIEVWIDIIKNNHTEEEQKKIIENSDFWLVSNKKSNSNEFLNKIHLLKDNKISKNDIDEYINKIYRDINYAKDEKGDNKESKKQMQIKKLLDFPLRVELLKKVHTEYFSDTAIKNDIIYKLKYSKYITYGNNAESAFIYLCGVIFNEFENSVQKNKFLEYSSENFAEKFSEAFRLFRTRKFVKSHREIVIPKDPLNQTFIKQLLGVNYIKETAKDEIVSLTTDRLSFENDYNNAIEHIDLNTQKDFEKDVKRHWSIQFKNENRKIDEKSSVSDIEDAGFNVVTNILEKKLDFAGEGIGLTSSNGCFFFFSDGPQPRIGWRYDWKDKYNGEEWIID